MVANHGALVKSIVYDRRGIFFLNFNLLRMYVCIIVHRYLILLDSLIEY